MTVIAAALTEDGVVMACDSQVSVGTQKGFTDIPKVWTTDQFAIGVAGCWRTAQVIRHWTDWPKYRKDEDTDLERFAVRSLWPAIKTALAGQGVLRNDSGVESYYSRMLLTVNDRIMEIASNGAVWSEPCHRMAIGSGGIEAMAYLGDTGPWTEADVIEAVRRATITDRGCSGQITVMNGRTLERRTVE